MKKTHIFLLALAVVLILATSLQGTLAYFTTYAEAKGGYEIHLGDTDIQESFSDWTKKVVISNSADGQPVYIRARAYAGSQYTLQYSGEGWTRVGDGYLYYDEILYSGQVTSELRIKIENIPEDTVVGDTFNVVVIYESAPVQYDENGVPYADWSLVLQGGD